MPSDRLKRLLAYGLVILAFCGILARMDQQDKIADKDTRERIDQTCFVFEKQHLDDVESLTDLYEYLLALPPEEKKLTFNKFILVQVPEREREANTDNAPQYCDSPNRGLPEPDPIVPERPEALTQDIIRLQKELMKNRRDR